MKRSRGKCPTRRVKRLVSGKDGLVSLKPQKGRLRRPVQKLHRLEASTTQFVSDEFGDSGPNGGESATQVQVWPPLTFLTLTLPLVQETVVCAVALSTGLVVVGDVASR